MQSLWTRLGHARWILGTFVVVAACGVIVLVLQHLSTSGPAAPADRELAALKASFRRPAQVPYPATNPFSEKKRLLGEALFNDRRLSLDNSMSCASCHDPAKAFADGRPLGVGVPGRALGRHTPTLWNLAWAGEVFWDGRAESLEVQALGPIQSPDEMALPLPQLVARLAADSAMVRAFAEVFPDDPQVSAANLAKAIATYERTLVSPLTRFDRWVEGDENALNGREIAGFRLFAGKAGCSACHIGFAFTDNQFHDIGRASSDRGRAVVKPAADTEHAFKTPGLRDIGRSAPYMHDGGLATVADVVTYYDTGITERATLSALLLRKLSLSEQERAQLVAFLGTL